MVFKELLLDMIKQSFELTYKKIFSNQIILEKLLLNLDKSFENQYVFFYGNEINIKDQIKEMEILNIDKDFILEFIAHINNSRDANFCVSTLTKTDKKTFTLIAINMCDIEFISMLIHECVHSTEATVNSDQTSLVGWDFRNPKVQMIDLSIIDKIMGKVKYCSNLLINEIMTEKIARDVLKNFKELFGKMFSNANLEAYESSYTTNLWIVEKFYEKEKANIIRSRTIEKDKANELIDLEIFSILKDLIFGYEEGLLMAYNLDILGKTKEAKRLKEDKILEINEWLDYLWPNKERDKI